MTPFQQFITNLPHGQYATFRNMVKLAMLKADIGISDQTFRDWENGTYEPKEPKRSIVNQVAIELTGNPIY